MGDNASFGGKEASDPPKEYDEIILNSLDDNDQTYIPKENPNVVYVSSLDCDEEKEEWPYTCEEKPILKTIAEASLYEKHVVSKKISPGVKGKRPHLFSKCQLSVEEYSIVNKAFQEEVNTSFIFGAEPNNLKSICFKIGSSENKLDYALECALLGMFQGERSEITLLLPQQSEKQKCHLSTTVPCVQCIIHLIEVSNPAENIWLANDEQKYVAALNLKEEAIVIFKKGRNVDSFHKFSIAAKLLLTTDNFLLESDTKDAKSLSLMSTLCSNMAECQLRENNPETAISLCQRALSCNPKNVKAMYRQASAAWSLGDVDQADKMLQILFQLEPTNMAAKRLKEVVQLKIKKYDEEYSKMMKKIFQS